MFALIHLFKQPSALFLFFSATFLSFLLFPFSVSDPLYSFHSLSSFVIIYVWRAVINKDKHSSMRLCVCVWEMDASSLIALLASPPLLTPLHIQLQAFFPPPPPSLHPGPQPGRRLQGQVRPGRRLHCGAAGGVGAGGWGPGIQAKPQTQDPDLACQPANWRAFVAGHNIRARGEVEDGGLSSGNGNG